MTHLHRLAVAFALSAIACGDDGGGSARGPYPDNPPLVREDIQARLCPHAARLLDVERACDGMDDGVNRLRVERCDGAGLDMSRAAPAATYAQGRDFYVLNVLFYDDWERLGGVSISAPPSAVRRSGAFVTLAPTWIAQNVGFGSMREFEEIDGQAVSVLDDQCEDHVRVHRYVPASGSNRIHRAKLGFTKRCPTARTETALPAEVTYRGCVVVQTPYPELPGAVAVPDAAEADPPAP